MTFVLLRKADPEQRIDGSLNVKVEIMGHNSLYGFDGTVPSSDTIYS